MTSVLSSNDVALVVNGINEFTFLTNAAGVTVGVKAQPAEVWDAQQTDVWDYRYEKDAVIHGYIVNRASGAMADEITTLVNGASSLLTATAAVIVAISATAF